MTEALIIGGGLSGSMLAIQLAQAGREVTLLEKERSAHHKVCGEFLSREAIAYLRSVDIDPIALGAETIRRVRFTSANRLIEAELPFSALSLSRYTLDEALLNHAQSLGANIHRGAHIESLTGNTATIRNREPISAQTIFLATGKHDLRHHDRPTGRQSDLIGFKMHYRLTLSQTAALKNHIDLFLFRGGYGGLSLIESNQANLCFVIRRRNLDKTPWPDLIASIRQQNPHLNQRLTGATALWDRPLAISRIPYGHLIHNNPSPIWHLGDQAAVIPSFTGDGMSIALHSAALAAQHYLTNRPAANFHHQLAHQLQSGMTLATRLSQAIVTPAGRALAPTLLGLYPQSLAHIAQATRIPASALLA